MFVKKRYPPLALLTLDACISRLKDNHPKLNLLRKAAAKYQKGYNGERKLDYHLTSLDNNFSILSDVTLSIYHKQFQLDSLIVTAHAIYFIEVKSLDGIVTFHPTLKQLTQENGEVLTGMKYPITQSDNNQFHLLRWLESKNIAGLPIKYFIAIAEQSTIIRVTSDEQYIHNVVSYVDEIPARIMQMNAKTAKMFPENQSLRNKVVSTILKHCEELNINILEKFNIDMKEILPGVHCPSCLKLGMQRTRYSWKCPNCHTFSRLAHKKALHDYALIYGNKITNKQCRSFLQIGSSTAYSIFKNTNGVELSVKNQRSWNLLIDQLRE